jgi:outer membrane lipoprotein
MKPWAGLPVFLAMIAATTAHCFTAEALKQVDRRVAFYDLSRNPEVFVGKNVILGGSIIAVAKREGGTRLEIAELPLTSTNRPDPGYESTGRFLATTPDPLDRDIYRTGLLITVIGTVTGRARVITDEDEEIYPLLAVKEMRVWSYYEPPRVAYEAEPRTTDVYDYPPPVYAPYYYPYYPYYPYSPWWFGWGIYIGDYWGHHHDGHGGHGGYGGHAPPRGSHPPGRPPSGGGVPPRGAPPARHR